MENSQQFSQIDQATLDVVNVGVIVLDQQGCVVQWNHWMEKHSGVGKNDAIGRSIRIIFPENESLRFFSAIEQAAWFFGREGYVGWIGCGIL